MDAEFSPRSTVRRSKSSFGMIYQETQRRMSDSFSDSIRLDQFLKLSDCAHTGGEAKLLIQAGEVTVNGELETRRRRKLVPGDRVVCRGEEVVVLSDTDKPPTE